MSYELSRLISDSLLRIVITSFDFFLTVLEMKQGFKSTLWKDFVNGNDR